MTFALFNFPLFFSARIMTFFFTWERRQLVWVNDYYSSVLSFMEDFFRAFAVYFFVRLSLPSILISRSSCFTPSNRQVSQNNSNNNKKWEIDGIIYSKSFKSIIISRCFFPILLCYKTLSDQILFLLQHDLRCIEGSGCDSLVHKVW